MGVEGFDKFKRRMDRLQSPAFKRDMRKALFMAGDLVRVEAQRSITAGSVSGKSHVPSAPNSPPNQDTGVLGGNIEVNQISDEEVQVSSEAPYAMALEFGTSRMAERPYMRPARDKKRREIQDLIVRVINKHNRS